MDAKGQSIIIDPLFVGLVLILLGWGVTLLIADDTVTEQQLGDIQADIIRNLGEIEETNFYQEVQVRQIAEETIYEIAEQGGLREREANCFNENFRENIYDENCKPQEIVRETFKEKFIEKHKEITNIPYNYRFEEGEEFRIIGLPQGKEEYTVNNRIEEDFEVTNVLSEEAQYSEPSESIREDQRYNLYIFRSARKYGVDPLLIKSIIKFESNFDETAGSGEGAKGLMQIVPITVDDLRLRIGISHDFCRERGLDQEKINDPDLFNAENPKILDPELNIEIGTCYFAFLFLERYPDRADLALSAYNAGPSGVRDQVLPLTQDYVDDVLGEYRRRSGSLTTITGKQVQEVEELTTRKVGKIIVTPSFNVSIKENFEDYEEIYLRVLENGNCLVKEDNQNCLEGDLGFEWEVGELKTLTEDAQDGIIPIEVETEFRSLQDVKRGPVKIKFNANTIWLRSP